MWSEHYVKFYVASDHTLCLLLCWSWSVCRAVFPCEILCSWSISFTRGIHAVFCRLFCIFNGTVCFCVFNQCNFWHTNRSCDKMWKPVAMICRNLFFFCLTTENAPKHYSEIGGKFGKTRRQGCPFLDFLETWKGQGICVVRKIWLWQLNKITYPYLIRTVINFSYVMFTENLE